MEIKFKRPSSRGLSRSERGAALWIRSSVSEERRVRVWAEKSDSLVDFHTGTWHNGLKLELLRDFCASLSEDTLVVAVDGYDVIVTGGRGRIANRIQQLLERHPGRVVASADQTFYFRGADERCGGAHYPDGAQPYRFLNSGGLAGRAGDLEKVAARALRDAEGWDGVSDQTLLHRRFLAEAAPCDGDGVRRNPCGADVPCAARTLALDHFQELFGNTGGRAFLRDFGVVDGRRP